MIHILRVVCGVLCGLVGIFFLFAGIIGFRQGRPAGSVGFVFGIAAIAGAIAYFLLSQRSEPVKRRKRSSARRIALPQEATTAERRAGPAPQTEGIARVFDPNTWNFDLAKVTPAGWVFGLASVAGMFGLMAICISWFGLKSPGQVPRWITNNKWIGALVLAPITVWFMFGARMMKSLGYPVFRDEQPTSRDRKSNAKRPSATAAGLPPRRPAEQTLPPRRKSQ